MEVWHIWFIVGIGFLIWEIFTPGFVVANVGLGCFAGALASFLGAGLAVQVAAFAGMNLVGFIFVRPVFLKYFYRAGDRKKLGLQALIGRNALVTEEIRPADGQGRVKLGSEEWKAVSDPGERIEPGRIVEVVRIESTVLVVTPVEE
jgi:membrane protein implicated in regulation of membrane protease activity